MDDTISWLTLARAPGLHAGHLRRPGAEDVEPTALLQESRAALVALGDRKDRSLLEFFKERFAKDASDGVRAESLRAIGKLSDRATIPFLEQAASVPSYRNLIAAAAKQAIERANAKQ